MKDEMFLEECKKVMENLLEILEVDVEELTIKEKELITAYSFGIMSEMAEESEVLQEVKNKGLDKAVVEVLMYDNGEKNELLKKVFNVTKEKDNNEFYIMTSQGRFEYCEYKEKNYNEIYDNLTSMIDVIVKKEYKNY